jgi:hypothetical protein
MNEQVINFGQTLVLASPVPGWDGLLLAVPLCGWMDNGRARCRATQSEK